MNRLDEPVFMAVPKPMLTEFGIHYRLESCGHYCDKSWKLSTIQRRNFKVATRRANTNLWLKIQVMRLQFVYQKKEAKVATVVLL